MPPLPSLLAPRSPLRTLQLRNCFLFVPLFIIFSALDGWRSTEDFPESLSVYYYGATVIEHSEFAFQKVKEPHQHCIESKLIHPLYRLLRINFSFILQRNIAVSQPQSESVIAISHWAASVPLCWSVNKWDCHGWRSSEWEAVRRYTIAWIRSWQSAGIALFAFRGKCYVESKSRVWQRISISTVRFTLNTQLPGPSARPYFLLSFSFSFYSDVEKLRASNPFGAHTYAKPDLIWRLKITFFHYLLLFIRSPIAAQFIFTKQKETDEERESFQSRLLRNCLPSDNQNKHDICSTFFV